MTGSDVCMMGIVGSMMGAVLTMGQLPDGVSMPQIFAKAATAQGRKENSLKKVSRDENNGSQASHLQGYLSSKSS